MAKSHTVQNVITVENLEQSYNITDHSYTTLSMDDTENDSLRVNPDYVIDTDTISSREEQETEKRELEQNCVQNEIHTGESESQGEATGQNSVMSQMPTTPVKNYMLKMKKEAYANQVEM